MSGVVDLIGRLPGHCHRHEVLYCLTSSVVAEVEAYSNYVSGYVPAMKQQISAGKPRL